MVTKQTLSFNQAALSNFNFFTSTVGFNNEDNCCQSQQFDKLIKDMLLKGSLSIIFWQVYHQ